MLAWLLMVPVDGLVCVGTESWLSEELVEQRAVSFESYLH
jgi:hypothetical protein